MVLRRISRKRMSKRLSKRLSKKLLKGGSGSALTSNPKPSLWFNGADADADAVAKGKLTHHNSYLVRYHKDTNISVILNINNTLKTFIIKENSSNSSNSSNSFQYGTGPQITATTLGEVVRQIKAQEEALARVGAAGAGAGAGAAGVGAVKRTCAYNSSNGKCSQSVNGPPEVLYCSMHLCTFPGCFESKASADAVCPKHTSGAVGAGAGAEAVVTAHPSTNVDSINNHAESISLNELKAEITEHLNTLTIDTSISSKIDNAIQTYLYENFALHNFPHPIPYDLRWAGANQPQTNKENDQVVSLQSLIMGWVEKRGSTLYYKPFNPGSGRGGFNSKKYQAIWNITSRTFDLQGKSASDNQHTALISASGRWWNTDDKISYNTKDLKTKLLIRKYNCQQYIPTSLNTGTGILDFDMSNILSSFDVIRIKPEHDVDKQCYKKSTLNQLKLNQEWPHNTKIYLTGKDITNIQKLINSSQLPPGSIRCVWAPPNNTDVYNVILNPANFINLTATNQFGIDIKMPNDHHLARFYNDMTTDDDANFNILDEIPEDMKEQWKKTLKASGLELKSNTF
jgi:hypothetical protein